MSRRQSDCDSLLHTSAKNFCRYCLIFSTAFPPRAVSDRFTTRSSSADRLRPRYPLRQSPAATRVSVPGVTPSLAERRDMGVGAERKSRRKSILSCCGVSAPSDFGKVWPSNVSCIIICSNTVANSAPGVSCEQAGVKIDLAIDNTCIIQQFEYQHNVVPLVRLLKRCTSRCRH